MLKSILGVFLAVISVWSASAAPAAFAEGSLPGQSSSMQSLQKTIDAAHPGTTIHVKAGQYTGHLTIRKPVTLIGEGNAVLNAAEQGTNITIQSSNVTIDGFVIKDSGKDLNSSPAGIRISSVHNITIKNNLFQNVEYGVYLDKASNCKIINNKIFGITQLSPEDRGDGIRFFNSNYNFVQNNIIEKTRDGMLFEFSSNCEIAGNTLTNLRYGLHYMYSDNNNFHDNLFSNDTAGAAPMYSKNITFQHNVFYHMTGYQSYGILLKEDSNFRIENNLILDNTVGIYMDAGFNNHISHNQILKNGIGFRIVGNSGNNQIYENNFIDNLTQVGKSEPGIQNQWSVSGHGNFWSNFTGIDPKHSGIAENSFDSADYYSTITAEFPILLQFANSPASSAVKSAENKFPLVQVYGITDNHPLMKPLPIPSEWNGYLSEYQKQWPLAGVAAAFSIALGGWLIIRVNRKKGKKYGRRILNGHFRSQRS